LDQRLVFEVIPPASRQPADRQAVRGYMLQYWERINSGASIQTSPTRASTRNLTGRPIGALSHVNHPGNSKGERRRILLRGWIMELIQREP
jgi:hypothetical protein